jgi:hypothetical protein
VVASVDSATIFIGHPGAIAEGAQCLEGSETPEATECKCEQRLPILKLLCSSTCLSPAAFVVLDLVVYLFWHNAPDRPNPSGTGN